MSRTGGSALATPPSRAITIRPVKASRCMLNSLVEVEASAVVTVRLHRQIAGIIKQHIGPQRAIDLRDSKHLHRHPSHEARGERRHTARGRDIDRTYAHHSVGAVHLIDEGCR